MAGEAILGTALGALLRSASLLVFDESHAMNRRHLLRAAGAAPVAMSLGPWAARAATAAAVTTRSRVRPGDAGWPTDAQWAQLGRDVGGRLAPVHSPLAACAGNAPDAACAALLASLKNPYYLGDTVGLTQTLGWVDAWTSMPSACAVAARTTGDVVAAVDFARENRLRLVVKGGGHSYQGTSNAADSLLVWTRQMNAITMHDDFVAAGCSDAPQRAVTVEAGAMWAQVYQAVSTRGGGYVQGGGCLSVGVAGLIQSGGFGSFSKAFGLASASLLQAEVVTADGVVRIANACTNPELFWGLKGGGGGSLGVMTRLTLRVHELPETFGAVNMTIQASSDDAYRRLVGMMMSFYDSALLNPHWGEQIRLRGDNVLKVAMVFQGLSRGEALAVWQPFIDAVSAAPRDYRFESPPLVLVLPARQFWAPSAFKKFSGLMRADDRPGAPEDNVFWPGDQGQAGQVLHGYGSAWLPAACLREDGRAALADALFAASRRWGLSLHVNKGLAGAPPEAIAAARNTAINPAALDAFALVILGAEGPPAHPGLPGHAPDVPAARRRAAAIAAAMRELRRLVPDPGSYVAESDYFEPDWQRAFWGANYARLLAVKQQVDPDGLFFVHHGVGSEAWSADGFTRLA
jgi:FAD/FMN-containing dehydrogenase